MRGPDAHRGVPRRCIVPAARLPKPGDVLRIRPPITPHHEWSIERLTAWRAEVVKVFDDGAYVMDTPDGAFVDYRIAGYCVHEDGAPIAEHPGASCERLGGCVRNPLDVCIRCGS